MPKIGVLYTIYFGIYEHAYHMSIPHFGIYMGLLVGILDLGKLSMLMSILDIGIYIYEH
jgi:voltage-gated potassium channel Kch